MDNNFEPQMNALDVPQENNLYENPGTAKKKFPKKLILIILGAILLIGAITWFALANTWNAKKVYTSLLKDFSEEMKKTSTILPFDDSKMGKLTVNNKEITKVNDDAPSYYEDMDGEKVEKYEVLTKDSQHFIKTDKFKLLWDENKKEAYVVKLDDGKEDGDVLKWTKNDEDDFYSSYRLDYDIRKYLAYLPSSLTGTSQSKDMMELSALVPEIMAKNLKNSYFIDKKNHGVNEYTLSMDNDQIAEFIQNVCDDLKKEKVFLRFLEAMHMDSVDEFQKNLDENVIKEIKDMKDLKVVSSIFARGNPKNLVGIKLEISTEDGKLLIDLNSEGKETLEKTKELKGMFSFKDDSSEYVGKLEITEKSVLLSFDAEYSRYYSLFYSGEPEKIKNSVTYELKTADDKVFEKTSHMIIDMVMDSNGSKEKFHMDIKGDDDKKAFIDCKEISFEYSDDKEDYGEVVLIRTLDKETFRKCNGIELIVKEGRNEIKFVLKAMDSKKLSETSEIQLQLVEDTAEQVLCTLKAKDGKPMKKSTHIEFEIPEEDMVFAIKTLDEKTFEKSAKIEIDYKGELDYDDVDLRMVIEGDKELMKAAKLTISINGEVDEEEFKFEMKLNGNKELAKASKVDFELLVKADDEEVKMTGNLESLDKKPLSESGKFKGGIECTTSDDMSFKANLDSKKGYDLQATSKYEGYYYSSDETVDIKYELVKPEKFGKLINIKDAVDADIDDITKILED